MRQHRNCLEADRIKRTRAAAAAGAINFKQRCGQCKTCMNNYAGGAGRRRRVEAAFRDAPKEMLKKPHGSGIIANIKIPQSLGARATPITVKTDIPVKTDIVAEFREWHVKEGAEITDVELIASGRQIREVEGLISKFRLANGDATKVGGWRKMKGFTILTDGKTDREAEVHWYQCHGVGRVKWKEKLD